MKKLTAILFLFCLTSTVLFGQKQQKIQNDSIIFTELIHDYGTIDVGSPGHCEFKFTNGMKTPLIVSNVKPSCGCTVADWTKEPILPGKTGVIKLNYNTKIPGTFSKTITVNSNAKNSTVILQIKGNVTLPK
ncbi:MAG TPA: DUF1573 domain-containing protein [Paludibacter sp.]